MAGTSHAPTPAWASVMLMITGFTMCTGAFVWHNDVPLWIAGGVVGLIGVVLGRIYHVLDPEEGLTPAHSEHADA